MPFDPFSPHDPFLVTKLTVPHTHTHLLPRSQLIKRLDLAIERKLTLLSAPAGSGKTALLQLWTQDQKTPVAWLSLDEQDNDLVRFWGSILASLMWYYPALKTPSLSPPFERHDQQASVLITMLLNTLATFEQDCFLVLDDYHLIYHADIHATFSFFLEHLPSSVHLIVASRSEPPFPLARLRAAGAILELRASDLRCTAAEIAAFFTDVVGLSLRPDALDSLQTRTEGWITGLQLVALSLQSMQTPQEQETFVATMSGQTRYIFEYLLEEVFLRQSAVVQRFLMETSILSLLNSALCRALCEWYDGSDLLEIVDHRNLFLVSLDYQHAWYRYHSLFAEALRHRFRQHYPERWSLLHQRAAQWYLEQHMMSQAIEHALMAGDLELAALGLIQVAEPFLARGNTARLQSWLDAFPHLFIRTQPPLAIISAFLLLLSSRFDAVEAWLLDAEHVLNTGNCPFPSSTLSAGHLRGYIATARAALALNAGETAQAITIAMAARASLSEHNVLLQSLLVLNLSDVYELQGNISSAIQVLNEASVLNETKKAPFVLLDALGDMGRLQAAQGHLYQAGATYRQALDLVREEAGDGRSLPPPAGKVLIYLGELHYEWNELERALHLVREGIEYCQQWMHLRHLLEGYVLLLRICLARETWKEFFAILETAQRLIQESQEISQQIQVSSPGPKLLQAIDQIEALQMRLQIIQGKPEDAERALRERYPRLEEHSCVCYACATVFVELLLALQRPEQALELVEQWFTDAEAKGQVGRIVDLSIYRALSFQAQGRSEEALTVLQQALVQANTGGYHRLFVDKGPSLRPLLQGLAARGLARRLVQKLLDAMPPQRLPQIFSPDRLSQREQEVLYLLADGRSNREIAAHLVLSLGTVKWYIHAIYTKLGVGSRTQALAEAHRRRLLG
ncbi:LuxR C-terminal-related transcriptional regulator [Ktedonospora formicarum]|uniref:Helix-turn-helix transcriptional regulator n=1 Tax=Ktedonospora formicarum TaxID=2778364 RepID=A0A8J3MUU0_9CHLR|nr:LuxR C-terminal-related transcriptional regulator [Ktedonospora formicarum]GHO47291.1 helix-turn-helix transcriptional regulator [Ktedonospora formicarum]